MAVVSQVLCFTKYHGAGNDFILICSDSLDQDHIVRLCSRQYGIGADGLVLTRGVGTAEIEARYFNSDGSSAMICGNALRCIAHQGFEKSVKPLDQLIVKMGGHPYRCFKDERGIRVELPLPILKAKGQCTVYKKELAYHWIDTGTDHLVVPVCEADLMRDDFKQIGETLSKSAIFQPTGVNVNFVWLVACDHIKMRTYEKGVYDETLACGSGAGAAVYAFDLLGKKPCTVCVEFISGEKLFFDIEKVDEGQIMEWSMIGKATPVFTGEMSL